MARMALVVGSSLRVQLTNPADQVGGRDMPESRPPVFRPMGRPTNTLAQMLIVDWSGGATQRPTRESPDCIQSDWPRGGWLIARGAMSLKTIRPTAHMGQRRCSLGMRWWMPLKQTELVELIRGDDATRLLLERDRLASEHSCRTVRHVGQPRVRHLTMQWLAGVCGAVWNFGIRKPRAASRHPSPTRARPAGRRRRARHLVAAGLGHSAAWACDRDRRRGRGVAPAVL